MHASGSEYSRVKSVSIAGTIYIYIYIYIYRWRNWLRHCAKSSKVAGSITDDIVGNFHWHNPAALWLWGRISL